MASIALRNIGCIDYLAYGSICKRAMFRPKVKLDVFFCQKSRRCLPGGGGVLICCFFHFFLEGMVHTHVRHFVDILCPSQDADLCVSFFGVT